MRIGFFILATLIFFADLSTAGDWQFITENPDGKYYIEKESLISSVGGTSPKVWIKFIYSQRRKKELASPLTNADYTVSLSEIDCPKRMTRPLWVNWYSNGVPMMDKIMQDAFLALQDWTPIVPDTAWDAVWKAVCKYVSAIPCGFNQIVKLCEKEGLKRENGVLSLHYNDEQISITLDYDPNGWVSVTWGSVAQKSMLIVSYWIETGIFKLRGYPNVEERNKYGEEIITEEKACGLVNGFLKVYMEGRGR